MISYIKGKITKKSLDYLLIENNGIGYFINTSFSTLKILNEGDESLIYTYMHIREDILDLYGFLQIEELEMFKKLISVNGIGPKAGLNILSTYDVNTIRIIIIKEDITKLSKVPKIGKKTASKIILELKDKVGSIENVNLQDDDMEIYLSEINNEDDSSDIVKVLVSLGFNQFEAKKVIDKIDLVGKSENDIIKEALKNINR